MRQWPGSRQGSIFCLSLSSAVLVCVVLISFPSRAQLGNSLGDLGTGEQDSLFKDDITVKGPDIFEALTNRPQRTQVSPSDDPNMKPSSDSSSSLSSGSGSKRLEGSSCIDCDLPRSQLQSVHDQASEGARLSHMAARGNRRGPSTPYDGQHNGESFFSGNRLLDLQKAARSAAGQCREVAQHMGGGQRCGPERSKGKCAAAVKDALLRARLLQTRPNGHAKDMPRELTRLGWNNVISKYPNPEQAPVGAVIVYEGGPYGHVEIKTEARQYCSDYCSELPGHRAIRNRRPIAIFIPRGLNG